METEELITIEENKNELRNIMKRSVSVKPVLRAVYKDLSEPFMIKQN